MAQLFALAEPEATDGQRCLTTQIRQTEDKCIKSIFTIVCLLITTLSSTTPITRYLSVQYQSRQILRATTFHFNLQQNGSNNQHLVPSRKHHLLD
jgi:hypothetical protein